MAMIRMFSSNGQNVLHALGEVRHSNVMIGLFALLCSAQPDHSRRGVKIPQKSQTGMWMTNQMTKWINMSAII